MSIERLWRDTSLPPLAKVRRRFDVDVIDDVAAAVRATMDGSGIAQRLSRGATVGVGVGSRGITHLPVIVAAVIGWFIARGARPFIVPAMGGHGGATAEGQVAMLASLGVTEESAGCAIRSDIDAVAIGRCHTGVGKTLDVHFDRHAAAADAVFFLSRVKPHPGFVARHESGICKMLAIGCGKQIAALTCHRMGYAHFPELMVRMAQVVIDRLPGIVGSLAIVENALHDTALVECVPREQLIRRVREAVGPDIHLMVDAHGRFDLPQARRLAQRFEEFDLYFMEEPLPPENLDAWVELKRSTRTPIATGERYVARFQFRELLEKYCCDYIQPDAIYTSGMNELRKIASMAEAYYCPVVPHNCNGPVCTAASIHAAACMPNFRMLEYIPVPEREDVLVEPLVMRDGAFALPTKPGLGVELNKAVFDRYVYQPRNLDHFTPVREIVL